jgi:hypothetical protein
MIIRLFLTAGHARAKLGAVVSSDIVASGESRPMWQTEDGNRVMRGAEWEFFREALGSLWEDVESEFYCNEPFTLGVDAFDELQPGQKLAVLALVGKALRDESAPPPKRSAFADGAVAAVFAFAGIMVECEIEAPTRGYKTFWRKRASAAWKEANHSRRAAVGVRSDDYEAWDFLVISAMEEAILGDKDYGLCHVFLDADPAVAHAYMRLMDIRDDYFLALAPDPTEEQLAEIRRTLRELTGYPGPQPE